MMLSVEDLHFSYNSHPVIKDIEFRLDRGVVLGLLGINGAGKSTLLKCLNRVLNPKRGSVLLNNEEILKMKGCDIARRMAYMPQRSSEEDLSVFDAVLLGRKPHIKWAAQDHDFRIVEDILKSMNLEQFALRPVNALSGGEMQKVIIARALAQEPEILLLDEPTSNLDVKNQFEVMAMVRKVVKEQKLSAIVSIHDLNLAFRFADLFLMMKHHSIYGLVPKEDVTSEMIREIYNIDVSIASIEGHPVVVPLYDA